MPRWISSARVLGVLALVGILSTVLRILDVAGYIQTAQALFAGRGWVVERLGRALLSPWFGPAVVAACLAVYLGERYLLPYLRSRSELELMVRQIGNAFHRPPRGCQYDALIHNQTGRKVFLSLDSITDYIEPTPEFYTECEVEMKDGEIVLGPDEHTRRVIEVSCMKYGEHDPKLHRHSHSIVLRDRRSGREKKIRIMGA
jgi:hypothetical protein